MGLFKKDKRSFFERITGSITVDEDDFDLDEEETRPQTSAKQPIIQKDKEWGGLNLEEEEEEGELSVDVYESPSEIVIQTMIAGVKPENMNISITREAVTLQGRRERQSEVSSSDYVVKELYWGNFSRTISLPSEVEPEESEAFEKHGLLTLRLPKIDKNKIQKVKIRSI